MQKNLTLDPSLQQRKKKRFDKGRGEIADGSETENLSEESLSDGDSDDSEVSQDMALPKYKKFFTQDGPAVKLKDIPAHYKKFTSRHVPYLYGTFNNWQPQPMIPVSKIAESFDTEPAPDFL